MRKKVAVVVFRVVYPAGGAGSNHRKNAAVCYPRQKFGSLFHNGKIRAEVGVEYFFEAEPSESRNHFARCGSSDFHTELFADSRSYRGSGLNDDVFACFHSRVNLVDFRNFHKRARGTYRNALSAQNTGRVCETSVACGGDDSLETSSFKAEDRKSVSVFTSFDTSSAKNTLRRVSFYRRGEHIDRNFGLCPLVHTVSRADELSDV